MPRLLLEIRYQYENEFEWDGTIEELLSAIPDQDPKFYNDILTKNVENTRLLTGDGIIEGHAVFEGDKLIFSSQLSGLPPHEWKTIKQIQEDLDQARKDLAQARKEQANE